MKQKVLRWIVNKLVINPTLPIQVMYVTYVTGILTSIILIALSPYWIWLGVIAFFTLLFTLSLGVTAFIILKEFMKNMTKSAEMMKDIDMDEVMALASQLFGNMPTKPTGPIGVIEDDRK